MIETVFGFADAEIPEHLPHGEGKGAEGGDQDKEKDDVLDFHGDGPDTIDGWEVVGRPSVRAGQRRP
jgi:hypothetical protein